MQRIGFAGQTVRRGNDVEESVLVGHQQHFFGKLVALAFLCRADADEMGVAVRTGKLRFSLPVPGDRAEGHGGKPPDEFVLAHRVAFLRGKEAGDQPARQARDRDRRDEGERGGDRSGQHEARRPGKRKLQAEADKRKGGEKGQQQDQERHPADIEPAQRVGEDRGTASGRVAVEVRQKTVDPEAGKKAQRFDGHNDRGCGQRGEKKRVLL